MKQDFIDNLLMYRVYIFLLVSARLIEAENLDGRLFRPKFQPRWVGLRLIFLCGI